MGRLSPCMIVFVCTGNTCRSPLAEGLCKKLLAERLACAADELRGREGGIAVRHTSHRGIERLVAQSRQPLTSTSANRPGGPPAPGPDKLVELFQDAVESGLLLVLDGGVLGNVPPSTLVDCTDSVPRMVREGAIPRAELRRAAGRLAP